MRQNLSRSYLKRGTTLKKIICLLLLCASIPGFAQVKKLNIAVNDLTGQGVDQSSTAIISDRLRTSLFKEGGFTVLERNAMQDILKEQGFQQSGCTSDACAVEIGQLLGVSYIVVGSVGKLGHLFTLDIRMIEVATGKIAYSENVDCDCPIEKVLTSSVVSIAKKISQNIRSTSAAAEALEKPAEQKSAGSQAVATGLGQDSSKAMNAQGKAPQTAPAPKPKKSPVLKITFGVVTLAAAGAGVAFDVMLRGKIDDNTKLKAEYASLGGNSQYAEYSTKISDNNKRANTYQILRNGSYILAGLGLAGFVVSFWF
jgi:TolB-like protein